MCYFVSSENKGQTCVRGHVCVPENILFAEIHRIVACFSMSMCGFVSGNLPYTFF